MRFGGSLFKKVEEKPSIPVVGTVTSSSTPQTTTPRSTEKPEGLPFEGSGTPPWDFFGLFHPIDHQFSSQDGKDMNQGFENADHVRQMREEEEIPELEDDEENGSFHGKEESEDSEDEFDEPDAENLVRSFENFNRVHDQGEGNDTSPSESSVESVTSETELLNGEKGNSPDLSPLKATTTVVAVPADTNKTQVKEDCIENKLAPKDFFSSIKDIELLFIKASDSGKEVPRMLEANKLHFRPMFQEKKSKILSLLPSCAS